MGDDMKNKIIEAFRNYRDSPTKEGTSFIEEVQFAEGFYYGHKSRDAEIEALKAEIESYKQSAGIVAESYMRKEAEINKLKEG